MKGKARFYNKNNGPRSFVFIRFRRNTNYVGVRGYVSLYATGYELALYTGIMGESAIA